jgi:hypothetical protein
LFTAAAAADGVAASDGGGCEPALLIRGGFFIAQGGEGREGLGEEGGGGQSPD